MNILSLQPYYGGSHIAFQNGWMAESQHDWTVLTLPPRHWKWRMHHAPIEFSHRLRSDFSDENFDLVLCSDFLNLAEFKGLAPQSITNLPTVLYFHENQFAYPSQRNDKRDLHYGFINLTSSLAADAVWFNSVFNRDSFLTGIETACQLWPDYQPLHVKQEIFAKSRIEPPGIELPHRNTEATRPDVANGRAKVQSPLHLLWAARWEHDKGPGDLLETLELLRRRNVDYRLSIIGQSFRRIPQEFETIRNKFSKHIIRWGFQESRQEYCSVLDEADVFLSTASHEFFGIAAAEAIAAGVYPILPNRLAYPELLRVGENEARRRFLYSGQPSDLAEKIEYLSKQNTISNCSELVELTAEIGQRLNWTRRGAELDQQLSILAALFETGNRSKT